MVIAASITQQQRRKFSLLLVFGVMAFLSVSKAFQPALLVVVSNQRHQNSSTNKNNNNYVTNQPLRMSDDWSNFSALDDDDEIVFGTKLDKNEYAVEDDSPEAKAAVGASMEPPEIEWDAAPIEVPAGACVVTMIR